MGQLAYDDWEANRYHTRTTPNTPAAGSNLEAGNSPSLQTGKLNTSSAPILATSFSNEFRVFSAKKISKVTGFSVESFKRGPNRGGDEFSAENRAIEGALLLLYGGDNTAVDAIMSLERVARKWSQVLTRN